MRSFTRQVKALSRKNALLRMRQWRVNLLQLVQAALFMFIIWLIVKALSYSNELSESFTTQRNPKASAIDQIPLCSTNIYLVKDRPCVTFIYTPSGDPDVEAIIQAVREHNDPPIPTSSVLGLPSMDDSDKYLIANPQTTLAAVHFFPGGGSTGSTSLGFIVQTNSTAQFFKGKFQHPNRLIQLPLQMAVEREATRLFVGRSRAQAQSNASLSPPALTPPSAAGAAAAVAAAPQGAMNSSQAAQDWIVARDGSIEPLLNGTYANVTGLQGPADGNSTAAFLGSAASNPFSSLGTSLGSEAPPAAGSAAASGALRRLLQLQQAPMPEVVINASTPAVWDVGIQIFAHPATVLQSLVGRIAPTFLFASSMFNFVLVLYSIVAEKESGLRQAMETMGLSRAAHWTVWASWEFLSAIFASVIIQILGYWAFQFDLWRKNDFILTFLVILENNLALTALALTFSTLLTKSASTISVGFVVFFLAWIMIVVIGFGFPYSTRFATVYRVIFSLFPWSLLTVAFVDFGDAAIGAAGTGLRWEDRDRYCLRGNPSPELIQSGRLGSYYKTQCVTSVQDCMVYLAIQIPAYLLLAIYLDIVLPDALGNQRSPLFFLTPSFWGWKFRGASTRRVKAALGKEEGVEAAAEEQDPMVIEEAERVKASARAFVESGTVPTLLPTDRPKPTATAATPTSPTPTPDAATLIADTNGKDPTPARAPAAFEVEVADEVPESVAVAEAPAGAEKPAVTLLGLSRTFTTRRFLWFGRRDFHAVHPTWLSLRKGECLALLGPNGAGKTTTIRCLTGVTGLSGGEAMLWGEAVGQPEGVTAIRKLMGVCPQFDVLYSDLTALEHLQLFAAIKGLPGTPATWREESMRLLREVRLDDVAHKRAGQFSGGMRRRLSCAVALLGDPLVLFLDEPSTGMDPVSRRYIWSLIDRISRDRCVVLTTHSMQEADVLGDRIAIMARGKLRALGTSTDLKARYGSGYRLSLLLAEKPQAPAAVTATAGASTAASPSPGARPSPPHFDSDPPAGAPSDPDTCAVSPSPTYSTAEVVAAFMRTQMPGLAAPLEASDASMTGKEGAVRALTYAIPSELEPEIGELLEALETHRAPLGIRDVYLTMSPLEEVFLSVVRAAELQHARESEAKAKVFVEDGPEGLQVEVEVAVGAAEVVSPDGRRHRIVWQQDEEGKLHAQRTERVG